MDQKVENLKTFDSLLKERKVWPSLLNPLWGAAGFTLGVETAAMGSKATMAFTIAVEDMISKHNQKQADILGEDEDDLHTIVESFQDEELEHSNIAVGHEGREARFYKLFRTVIQRGCCAAIKIAKRV